MKIKKFSKCTSITANPCHIPVAIETKGVCDPNAFLKGTWNLELGHRIYGATGEPKSYSLLPAEAVQRGDTASVIGTHAVRHHMITLSVMFQQAGRPNL